MTSEKDEVGRLQEELGLLRAEKALNDEKLAKFEASYQTLFQSMNEMVAIHEIVTDSAGTPVDYRILACNEAYPKMTGIPRENAIGRLGSEVYGSTPPPYLREYALVAITRQSKTILDYYGPMDKFFNISIVSPEPNHFATITTDLTDFYRAKNLIVNKNKELENYLYIASHDLRAPLVNIQGFGARLDKQVGELETLATADFSTPEERKAAMEPLREEIQKALRYISSNAIKMDKLISGLLVISRTGRIAMNIQRIGMSALISGIFQSLSFQSDQTGAQVEMTTINDCWGDEGLLNQLFMNIIGNAIKYREPSRALRIRVSSEIVGKYVVYRISDNGIGIADRHKERIWEVYYRVSPNPDRPGEGIGLSIVKRIVDKHQGKVWLESEEGKGTTFFVQLPSYQFTEMD